MSEPSPNCPRCDRRIDGEAITVGPPSHLSDHHRFRFHERCLAEWHRFADRLFDLSKHGVAPTLIEYPRNHGPEDLIEGLPEESRFGGDRGRPEPSDGRRTER